jgi:plastocyanin
MHAIPKHPSWKSVTMAAGALAALALLLVLTVGAGSPASASPTATASGSATVTMKNIKYNPGTIRISPGDRVVWENLDKTKHTATSSRFDTGKIKPGAAVAVRFTAKGTYPYHCTIHEGMHGKIFVG